MLAEAQTWLFTHLVQPALYALDASFYAEDAYDAIEALLIGAGECLLLLGLLRPLEAWRPLERWADRRAVRVDVLYTLIQRLGLVPLLLFLLLQGPLLAVQSWLALRGWTPQQIEGLSPWLAAHPLASFVVYLLLLDGLDYGRHRLQHTLAFWWALHALHHSQRQMTLWSDDRNHLLDDGLELLWFAAAGLAIGVPPEQFPALALCTRLIESFSHANLRLAPPRWLTRLVVLPTYHRRHHAIGHGHEGRCRGCNFATLFPLWDLLFGTADFSCEPVQTGIRDQRVGRDYGEGFWNQQALGLLRLWRALLRAER